MDFIHIDIYVISINPIAVHSDTQALVIFYLKTLDSDIVASIKVETDVLQSAFTVDNRSEMVFRFKGDPVRVRSSFFIQETWF